MEKIVAQTLDGWFFGRETRRLRYADGRRIEVGKTHRVRGELEMCAHGLHASERAIDALAFAPGPIIYRVRLHGTILRSDGKACASARTYLAGGVDATETLRSFLRWCALDVAHLWDAPPIVRQYLETGDESIRAGARDAAWDAARAGARGAAWDAAWGAAWDALRVVARAIARAVARAGADTRFDAELERRLAALIAEQ